MAAILARKSLSALRSRQLVLAGQALQGTNAPSGTLLYLSNGSLETSITTAKSSEINVLVPGAGPDSDWQFSHVYKDGQFVITPVSHSGG